MLLPKDFVSTMSDEEMAKLDPIVQKQSRSLYR